MVGDDPVVVGWGQRGGRGWGQFDGEGWGQHGGHGWGQPDGNDWGQPDGGGWGQPDGNGWGQFDGDGWGQPDGGLVEWIPTPYRAVTVALTGFSYTLGQILLAGIAYAVPHWRWLQLTVSLPFFVFFLFSWWLAESARWLVLAGKEEKAVQILQRVAKINGREEEGKKITVEVPPPQPGGSPSPHPSHPVSPFSISFSYYGLAMDLQNFGVSIYLIQVIFGAVDFPAKLVVTVSVSYIGRRVSLMVALALAGLVIIANIFLYPTPIRQTGLGFGSTMARVGGIVAPLVKMMEEYYPFLPPAVYGVAPIAAAVAAGFLPETLNRPLPDTIEEVENRWVTPKSQQNPNIPMAHLKIQGNP
uniref:Solute carrier family 22 member 6 n=1 Tax=Phasianus colchicus TaxID=9054 RepID=A0A669QTG7_PHACC